MDGLRSNAAIAGVALIVLLALGETTTAGRLWLLAWVLGLLLLRGAGRHYRR